MFRLNRPHTTHLRVFHAGSVAVIVGALLATSTPVSHSLEPSDPDGCIPVAIMAMRGSSEGPVPPAQYGPGVRSNGYEGSILTRLFWGYSQQFSALPELSGVPIIGLSTADGYRADAVDSGGFVASTRPHSRLWRSAVDGASAAIKKMDEFQAQQPTSCPQTSWILIGYSQGAIVARLAYSEARERVASIATIGNPFHVAGKPGNYGSGSAYDGALASLIKGDDSLVTDYYNYRSALSVDFCAIGDPVCDTVNHGSWLTHLLYWLNPWDALYPGAYLKDMVVDAYFGHRRTPGAPQAKLTVATPIADMPTVVSAGRSLAQAGSKFAYDLDGNGSFETPGGAALTRTFPEGKHWIGVQITDPSGRRDSEHIWIRSMNRNEVF